MGDQMKQKRSGSVLVISLFIIFTLTILILGYVEIINYNLATVKSERMRVCALATASSGIEDALFEVQQNRVWSKATIASLDSHWIEIASSNTLTLAKTSNPAAGGKQLTTVPPEYIATYSVTLQFENPGNPYSGTINVTSVGTVKDLVNDGESYTRTLYSKVIRNVIGQVIILESSN